MNNIQKILVAIIIPLAIITAALGIGQNVGYSRWFADSLEYAWWVYTIAILLIVYIEYKLFSDYKNKE